MQITLPKEVLAKLPEPASDGLVRVTAGIKIGQDGTADLVEIDDTPLATGPEEDAEADPEDGDTPDLGAMADEIYGRK